MQIKVCRPLTIQRIDLLPGAKEKKSKQKSKSKGIRLSISNSRPKSRENHLKLDISQRTCSGSKDKVSDYRLNRSINQKKWNTKKCLQLCGENEDFSLEQDRLQLKLDCDSPPRLNSMRRVTRYQINQARNLKRWSQCMPETPINKILFMDDQNQDQQRKDCKSKLKIFSSIQLDSQKFCSTQVSTNNSIQFGKWN